MAHRPVLVSWIGHADLAALCRDLPAAAADAVRTAAGLRDRLAGDPPGPVRTAVDSRPWAAVHLLSNYPPAVNAAYRKWLGRRVTIHRVGLADPTDYAAVFRAADEVLGRVYPATGRPHVLLSPGTPAMAAVWVLLGKSRYPADFLQAFRGRVTPADIPYDLIDDFVPELLREPDRAFQHLASTAPGPGDGFAGLVAGSPSMRLAVGRARRAAVRDVTVLLLGETGTGKSEFAQAIHQTSRRRAGPFVAVNCAALPRELLESELFGHEKGAFTGADRRRAGALAAADGGTLFLDEVGECDPLLQAKLLRAVQPVTGEPPGHCEFRPVGADRSATADVRLIAATNRDPLAEVRAGRLREDLYYRLAVVTLRLPPLRERGADLPALAATLMNAINQDFARHEPGYVHKRLSAAAARFVRSHGWPGNVRQLHNTLVQAAVFAAGDEIDRIDLQAAAGETGGPAVAPLGQPLGDGFCLKALLEDVQRHYLRRAMAEAGGVKARAAALLGVPSYQSLDQQLRRLGVAPPAGSA